MLDEKIYLKVCYKKCLDVKCIYLVENEYWLVEIEECNIVDYIDYIVIIWHNWYFGIDFGLYYMKCYVL